MEKIKEDRNRVNVVDLDIGKIDDFMKDCSRQQRAIHVSQ